MSFGDARVNITEHIENIQAKRVSVVGSSGDPIGAVGDSLKITDEFSLSQLTELRMFLAALAACKQTTNESLRVSVQTAPTTLVYDYTQWGYVTPSVAKWYEFHSIGNNLAIQSNINNVTRV